MSENDVVDLRILDSEYRISCPAKEQDALREAASQLENQMLTIRKSGKVLSTERVAVMAALHMCFDLRQLQQQQEANEQVLREHLDKLASRCEALHSSSLAD